MFIYSKDGRNVLGTFLHNLLWISLLFFRKFLLSLKRSLKPIRALHHVREFRKKSWEWLTSHSRHTYYMLTAKRLWLLPSISCPTTIYDVLILLRSLNPNSPVHLYIYTKWLRPSLYRSPKIDWWQPIGSIPIPTPSCLYFVCFPGRNGQTARK